MRTLFALALFALACGCSDRSSRPSGAGATSSIPSGPDPVVLRVSRDGGSVTAHAYPAVDSVLWRSNSRAPALREIIGFGAEDGYLAAIDRRRSAVRVDLRVGAVTTSKDSLLSLLSSADGEAIYAVTAAGQLTRFTPSGGTWKFAPSLPMAALFAQIDGSLIVAGAVADRAVVWRVRPPGQDIVDTVTFTVGGDARANTGMISATAGSLADRVFFGAGTKVIAVRTRDMTKALELDLDDPITALAATPSGDRLFVALADDRSLRVVDRFEEKVSGKIKLPSPARALRMDALGRYVLAHAGGDTVYVVSLADDEVVGTMFSTWRADLPFVLADGAIALASGADVSFSMPGAESQARVVAGGAKDLWYGMRWNGFRPRAKGLDQPVEFRRSAPRDSSVGGDSGRRVVPPDSGRVSMLQPASNSRTSASASMPGTLDEPSAPAPRAAITKPATAAADSRSGTTVKGSTPRQFTISFTAAKSERGARSVAASLRIPGHTPRVTSAERDGIIVYRVVLGPFPTRADAERIGQASGQSYWVFEGVP
ncbi:MAG: SPOR domain-containing protein [Gemmatimonadaceae bacterium]|nr:SPOR domain-containing protein [Gemmatimonadaceae bacterium]